MRTVIPGIISGIIGVVLSRFLFFVQGFTGDEFVTDYRIGVFSASASILLLICYYKIKK